MTNNAMRQAIDVWPASAQTLAIRHLLLVSAAFLVCAFLAGRAQGATILQDQNNRTDQILAASPIGQTFTAQDAKIATIGFFFDDFNSFLPNGPTSMLLFEGVGTGGALLGTAFATLTPGNLGFVDFDFSAASLSVGSIYTAIVERPNQRWAVQGNQHSLPDGTPIPGRVDYAGGDAIMNGAVVPILDLRFRVTPLTAVPEPGSALLIVMGLLVLLLKTRSRSNLVA